MQETLQKTSCMVWLILASTILFYCLDFFFRLSPSLVLMPLMQQYHTNSFGMGCMASAFYLGYTLFQIPAGMLLDRVSFVLIVVASIVLCVMTFILFVGGQQYWLGLIYRFLIGIFSAFSFLSVLYLAKEYFPTRFFTRISGITIGMGTLMAACLQLLSSYFLINKQWQILYRHISYFGLLLAVFLLLGYQTVQKKQNAQPKLSTAFRDFQKPALILNALIGGLFYLPTSVFANLWGITFLTQKYGLSISLASGGILALFLGWGIGSPLMGWVVDKLQRERIYMGISALFAAGVLTYLIESSLHSVMIIYGLLFMLGIFSSGQVIVWRIYSKTVGDTVSGSGIAMTNMLILFCSVIAQSLVGWLMHIDPNAMSLLSTAQITKHLQHGLECLPICLCLAGCLSLLLPTEGKRI